MTTDEFINRAIKVHGNKYDYSESEYDGKDKPLKIICSIHGKFMQTPNNHWKGKGCAKCKCNCKSNTDEFIKKANIIHNNFYGYDKVDYKNTNTKVIISCPIHGEFMQTPDKHLAGHGCIKCGADKARETNLAKYGTQYPIQSDIVKTKIASTNLERYGTENAAASDEIKTKIKNTNLNKYGVEYAISSKEVRDKITTTMTKRYGAKTPFESNHIKQKAKSSILKKYGVESAFASDEIKAKIKNTNLNKYGVEYPLQSDEIRKKASMTCYSKYKTDNPLKLLYIQQQCRQTSLMRYGTQYPAQSECIMNKTKQTNLDRYGVEYPMQSSEILEKAKQTNFKKYGASHPLKSEIGKHNLNQISLKKYGTAYPSQSKIVQRKVSETKRKNNTFHTSKPEQLLYEMLIAKFGTDNVIRQFSSDEYPFNADFYIKNINTYIELNALWTHGNHFFDENNQDDIAKLKLWQEKAKNSEFYKNAIENWTIRDINKHDTAIRNNLNYVVFWKNNLSDAKEWLQNY